jgi:excisionase family DNA binding protein
MQKKFLTTDEISNFYGIGEDTLRGLVDSGDLKALADRGDWKYRREELEALIKSGKLHPTKELPVMDEDAVDSDPDFPVQSAGSEKVDFLELDESALSADSPPPSKASSSSDVVVVLQPAAGGRSDSDIHLRGRDVPPGVDDATVLTDVNQVTPSVDSDHVLDETAEEAKEDSGLTLDAGDSGISLEGDSGISLDASDSGLTLEKARKSARAKDAATEPMVDQLKVTPDQESLLLGEDSGIPQLKFGESSGSLPKLFEDKPDGATTVLSTEEEQPSSFSGAVEAGASVQDLEVVEELQGSSAEEAIFADDEEEVVEASDEVFSEEYAEASGEGEEFLAAAPSKAKASEPTWGMLVNLSVIAASVLIAANAWLVVEGMTTMWNGAAPSGLASSLISMFAGLM